MGTTIKKLLKKTFSLFGRALRWPFKPFDLSDAFVFGGTGLLAYGLSNVYPPAAFMAPGIIFIYLGLWGARGHNRKA